MVDGIVASAGIQGAGVGYKGFCFQPEQFGNQCLDTVGVDVCGVFFFAYVNFNGGEVVFSEAVFEFSGPE